MRDDDSLLREISRMEADEAGIAVYTVAGILFLAGVISAGFVLICLVLGLGRLTGWW